MIIKFEKIPRFSRLSSGGCCAGCEGWRGEGARRRTFRSYVFRGTALTDGNCRIRAGKKEKDTLACPLFITELDSWPSIGAIALSPPCARDGEGRERSSPLSINYFVAIRLCQAALCLIPALSTDGRLYLFSRQNENQL